MKRYFLKLSARLGLATPAASAPATLLATALVVSLALSAPPAHAQIAAPGDEYYKVHTVHRFQYGTFAGNFVPWADNTQEATSLSFATSHDTSVVIGTLGTSSSYNASAGIFTADMNSYLSDSARTGVYHLLTNTLTVDLYIKGTTGTPYWIRILATGTASASRMHGLPGSLQDVNGTSTGGFMDSVASVNTTASVSIPVADTLLVAGTTTAQITVGADTYSYAGTYTLDAPASATQNICVLGCMTEAARFDASGGGHIEIDVYPHVNPLSVGGPAPAGMALSMRASPNPLRGFTRIAFRAPAGGRTQIEAFDVRGRRVARLFDAAASGELEEFTWHARGLAHGIYFLRMRHGAGTATEKVALVP